MDLEKKTPRLDPISRVFLEGVYDEECVLFKLNGLWHLLQKIWRNVKDCWKASIFDTSSSRDKTEFEEYSIISYINLSKTSYSSDYQWGVPRPFPARPVAFPKRKGININMMPFILNSKFEDCYLPKFVKPYWKMISQCIFGDEEIGTVCYLTIHESKVEESTSQRRPGIHTERPGRLELRGAQLNEVDKGQGDALMENETVYHHWGFGLYDQENLTLQGGIFMASNVANSCQIWNCQIIDDNCIGHLGDVEHLRNLLPEGEVMQPNCLYWLTDRTPHESLLLQKATNRQFFRLVTSQVSLWFEDHSTKNPLGIVPDPKITKIVKGSKFKQGDAYIVSDVVKET